VDLLGFNHIAINTLDIENSLLFYRDVLRLKQLHKVDTEESLTIILAIPGGGSIELIQMCGDSDCSMKELKINMNHLAFNVNDVLNFENYLRNANVEIVTPCMDLEAFNTRVVKCKDPDGNIIAFRKDIQ
jgi:catechol 2,3-dioxygenase-like lactoylglutathione lyase family enzyme